MQVGSTFAPSIATMLQFLPAQPFSEDLDTKDFILIKGARVNNLKNVDVAIPRNKLVVITGLSGSGKSSLAFETLFAEGQRMYVESLSSYQRQFLGRMEKPEVDYIKGVSPAIAIEQKVNTKNPRSTVGTTTEIYDYLKLLFARIGKTYSPISGIEVKRDSVDDVVSYLMALPDGTRTLILAPLMLQHGRSFEDELKVLLQKGFARIWDGENLSFIDELLSGLPKWQEGKFFIVVDRVTIDSEAQDLSFRLSDSVQTTFFEGAGTCLIQTPSGSRSFSDRFEADGMDFEEPTVNLFSFNNPYGACKTCEGFGRVLGIDPDLVFPDRSLSVFEQAIAPWRGEQLAEEWLNPLLKNGIKFDFPIHRPVADLTEKELLVLWEGNKFFRGLNEFFKFLESNTYKIQYRVLLSRFRGRTTCPDCRGTRLRKDAGYVKIAGTSIQDLCLLPIHKVAAFFQSLELSEADHAITKQLTAEINNRLGYMQDVGLGYLTLNRLTSTLSGGEFQRIKLATSLGSALVGSMYILDEPSIGLHPRDTRRLIKVLKTLRDLGNTVVVVEHEEEVMLAADQIIDIGPDAGSMGGNLIFQGSFEQKSNIPKSLDWPKGSYTLKYLLGTDLMEVPKVRRAWRDAIEVVGARENNLQNLHIKFPLDVLTVVTGVSGSGKSTLVRKILVPALSKIIGIGAEETGHYDRLAGAYNRIVNVKFVDQNPIGKSSRSNPVSYSSAFDPIRTLFSEQPISKQRGYTPGFFSFNVDGGRCEKCQGEGFEVVEMQFMADLYLKCEACGGKRYKKEILEVTYKGKSISDVLEMTVDESITFFEEKPRIKDRIIPLQTVGLGYVKLGQSSNTLSGGEAQRIKLASYLSKAVENARNYLFVFDEPTTGLHFHDIRVLLKAINALVDQGNTVIIIEHNTEVIKCADWVIDMGPEGGEFGGKVCFEGTPEQLATVVGNYTGEFLKSKL